MIEESQAGRKLRDLKRRLKQENPVLEHVVDRFQDLDRISRRLGFFDRRESYANRTSWWPLVSVLGVYSSGKSSFINHFLGCRLQATGNQAVDDKFTVICFTDDKTVRVLPGLALDADPRFPFYRISQAIDEVAQGEGRRIDAYLQLKTCASEQLRGRILIDSPGFDADAQRTSTLRITDHIIDLSDLVLVFFDARHPETGSMHDTLEHLVRRTISRRDTNKFIFVLNQIDATLKEDNAEEVFASWQRALAQSGLTTGCFYAVCIPELAVSIAEPSLRARFEGKRDAALKAISHRIEHVSVERVYRIRRHPGAERPHAGERGRAPPAAVSRPVAAADPLGGRCCVRGAAARVSCRHRAGRVLGRADPADPTLGKTVGVSRVPDGAARRRGRGRRVHPFCDPALGVRADRAQPGVRSECP